MKGLFVKEKMEKMFWLHKIKTKFSPSCEIVLKCQGLLEINKLIY
jgi:hypothetical protein